MTPWPRVVRIDVRTIMGAGSTPPQSNLVTRPTGQRVRRAIQSMLRSCGSARLVSVIDLTGVVVLDYSCADEVIAKLVVRHLGRDRPSDAFFLFRASEANHRHALHDVLERQGLAAACDLGDGYRLLGAVSADEDRAWRALELRGAISPGGLDAVVGDDAGRLLGALAGRRLTLTGPGGAAVALSAAMARGAEVGRAGALAASPADGPGANAAQTGRVQAGDTSGFLVHSPISVKSERNRS